MSANVLRKLISPKNVGLVRFLVNCYMPFVGAGIKIVALAQDYRYVKVKLKKGFLNTNYVGVHFGGSIYAMTDPFYMFLLINILGKEYIVWDKGAEIDFLKPGRTDLYAEFRITDDILEDVKAKTKDGEKYIFTLPAEVVDAEGTTIAKIEKVLYVRKKSG